IVLDLADTQSNLSSDPVTVGAGAVQTFSTIAAGDRTRVMVDLSRMTTYDYQSTNGKVVLTISGDGAMANAPASSGTSKYEVENIDFHRGEEGQSRVVIKMDKAGANVAVNTRNGGLTIDLFDTFLPSNLNQRLDVVDFATPVQIIDSTERRDQVQVKL